MESFDFAIVGAGIAGASVGFELAARARVLVLERESQPGTHTTGRSAAVYARTYGNEAIRNLTLGSWDFLSAPPAGFAEVPILTPRGSMFVGRPDQLEALDRLAEADRRLASEVRRLDGAAARALVPVLRPEQTGGGVHDPLAMDIDVHALHHGFLRAMKARGGRLATDAEVLGLERGPEGWRIETRAGRFAAPVLIDAAGAWAEQIAALAGAAPIGLVPKRRTAITFAAPEGLAIDDWPVVVGIDEDFYFKPDAGRILGSPADETPMAPCDVQPEELDIAIAVDRIQTAADLEIPRIESKWAGLRSFVADKTPVVGFDPEVEGFFWLAGQGGYGIQTCHAMGRVAAALASGAPVPSDLADVNVDAAALSPARPRTEEAAK